MSLQLSESGFRPQISAYYEKSKNCMVVEQFDAGSDEGRVVFEGPNNPKIPEAIQDLTFFLHLVLLGKGKPKDFEKQAKMIQQYNEDLWVIISTTYELGG